MPNRRLLQLRFVCTCLVLAMLLPLCACGKKPNKLDPPPGVENDTFPLTYPDPATDPKP